MYKERLGQMPYDMNAYRYLWSQMDECVWRGAGEGLGGGRVKGGERGHYSR